MQDKKENCYNAACPKCKNKITDPKITRCPRCFAVLQPLVGCTGCTKCKTSCYP